MANEIDDTGLTQRLALAIELALEAGRMALTFQRQQQTLDVTSKGTQDFVTAADRAIEQRLRQALATDLGDGILGEEFGLIRSPPGRPLWVVDPIDGTRNFIHGNPRWCVSIGLLVAGIPTLGVIFQPATGDLYVGRRGHGATRNGRPLHVSGARNADRPLIEVGKAANMPIPAYLALMQSVMEAGFETRRGGSGALGIAQVATGEIDGYIEAHINAWDVAAALVLIAEAGGRISPFFSGHGLMTGNAILAATPEIASRLAKSSGIDLE